MTLEEDRNYILTSGCIYFQNLDNLSLYQRQNQLDEAIHRMLDNEGVQKLIAAQSSASSSGSSDGQSDANTSRAKSPLSQAMLQIHSPDSVPDINIGETVVLQMEEGRATLIAHPDNGLLLDKQLETNSSQKSSGSDSDEVFDRDKDESETKTSPTLHSVISNLISTRVATLSSEEIKLNDNEPVSKVENVAIRNGVEDSSVMQNDEQFSKSGQVEEKERDSKVGGLMSEKDKNSNAVIAGKVNGSPEATGKTAHSPKQKKSPTGELIVPQPNSPQILRSQASTGSPAIAVSQPTSVQEKRRSHRGPSKIPHPAFNIPVTTYDRNGGLYNYNLPDRGLGSMMNSSPVPLSVSPPVVSAPRFPVTIATTIPGQVLGFMSPSWQMQRPIGHSPASNDSHSSGSPLDLSSVREASPNLPKVMNQVGVVAKEKPVNKQQLEPKQLSTSKSSPLTGSTKVVTVAKPDASNEAVKQTSLVSASKVPYTQEMLYLFDKELEIVAVGKNKWIVRNENELVNVVKKKTDSEPSGEITASTSHLDGADGTKTVPIQNGNSLNSTEENKRPLNSESDSHRSKVTKLVNGDVHTTVSSVQSKLSSAVSSMTNDTIPHSAVNLQTDKNLT